MDKFIQIIKEIRKEVEKALKKTNEMMKWRTDKFREEAIKYKEGDLVWMNNSNISSDCPAKKLAFKGARLFLTRSLTRDLIFSFISYFISFSFLFFFYF